MMTDNTKIGILMLSLGFLFIVLGVLLFFDSGLLAIGNVLLLVGFPMILGWQRALRLFNPFRRTDKWRGIACFFLGIVLVLLRWGFFGIIIELIGMVEMFGTFLPIVVTFLRSVPYVGPIFSLPLVGRVVDFLAGVRTRRAPV